jgi:hypothetical protein
LLGYQFAIPHLFLPFTYPFGHITIWIDCFPPQRDYFPLLPISIQFFHCSWPSNSAFPISNMIFASIFIQLKNPSRANRLIVKSRPFSFIHPHPPRSHCCVQKNHHQKPSQCFLFSHGPMVGHRTMETIQNGFPKIFCLCQNSSTNPPSVLFSLQTLLLLLTIVAILESLDSSTFSSHSAQFRSHPFP